MRATIVGTVGNLSIACENGDKRLLGDVHVEGRGFIHAAFEDTAYTAQFAQGVAGFISVFGQQSEALRRLLVVRNLDKRYQQIIDGYVDLRDLTTFEKEGDKVFINAILNASDFNYFCNFVELHFFTELRFIMDLPFHELPITADAQADLATKYRYILPTKRDFQSGKPCFFPNAGISFGFEHPKPDGGSALRPAISEAGD
jgi:hypothetical protein